MQCIEQEVKKGSHRRCEEAWRCAGRLHLRGEVRKWWRWRERSRVRRLFREPSRRRLPRSSPARSELEFCSPESEWDRSGPLGRLLRAICYPVRKDLNFLWWVFAIDDRKEGGAGSLACAGRAGIRISSAFRRTQLNSERGTIG